MEEESAVPWREMGGVCSGAFLYSYLGVKQIKTLESFTGLV